MLTITLDSSISLNPLSTVKKYEGFFENIVGWILFCFGAAYRIVDDNQTYYLNAHSFIQTLVPLGESKQLQRLFLETLHPMIGVEITTQKVMQVAQALKGISTEKEAIEALERFKYRDLEILSFNPDNLEAKLKPGDILSKKVPDGHFHVVVWGQGFIQRFIPGMKEREGYKFSHVAIYLGNGKIAEASPDSEGCEVRILSLNDSRFALKDKGYRYVVSRLKNQSLALQAAEVAEKIAVIVPDSSKEAKQETPYKYTKLQALRSIWHPSCFGPFARYRYLKQYIDDRKNQLPRDFMALKNFFCSYFVGYCLQTAESRDIMPKILGNQDAPPRLFTRFGNAISRGLWARVRRIQQWCQMSKDVTMQFDAKRLTPQDFRNFIVRNPELIQDVYLIG